MNKVVLMGRLTKDPELKTTQSGTSVCSFSVAADRSYTPKGEEKKTDFFNVVAWRATADFVSKYFSKGRMILVIGELQNRSYTDKDGNNRWVTEIIAESVHFTGEAKQEKSNTANVAMEVDDDEDYPF